MTAVRRCMEMLEKLFARNRLQKREPDDGRLRIRFNILGQRPGGQGQIGMTMREHLQAGHCDGSRVVMNMYFLS